MKRALTCAVLFLAAFHGDGPPSFVPAAGAVVGRPATPVSVAGAARRTARSDVRAGAPVAATAAVATTAVATTAVAAGATAAVVARPAMGTVVPVLPAGCAAVNYGTVPYSNCGGVFYKPVYQGADLVYVVSPPP